MSPITPIRRPIWSWLAAPFIRPRMTSVNRMRRFYWTAAAVDTEGVGAIVIDDKGAIILVRHSYLRDWMIPTGSPIARELPKNAMIREFKEEIGLTRFTAIDHLESGQRRSRYHMFKVAGAVASLAGLSRSNR